MNTENITMVIATIAVVVVMTMIGYASYKSIWAEANLDKSEFHAACLKAGYSVDECSFEWVKEGR